ncbi:tRNA (adenosine(37)-N6)-threonylcarbamoyltransferase complex ATPase subunit type 1 TsaE [Spiroplasma cantharicola]|uniref:tRNA threonylcarbamoyladenosine biosynthesis protein TsaE n=1 Tax=Spiroplasma cantharicola TaxID=362837 RepID=A0A0M4K0R5_9MOLU|nr:tRNA (adenosine(37)-N6)-threonylcarbamoyltransferase complex ATPase subunit type 1 TsaE [Spiroplasma cantharicola]ALD66075.1 tRNA threonylcarbamoyladenosine biosynthesis protein TsaE [Spiroplasma cantharicola]
MRLEINNLEELNKVIAVILPRIKQNCCLILDGEMGAGKTTFSKYLLQEMGLKELVTSPTFTIMNQYQIKELKINHIDAYRLSLQEDGEMYLEEMINSFNIIEWSQNLAIDYFNYFNVIKISIEIINENKRIFIIEETK